MRKFFICLLMSLVLLTSYIPTCSAQGDTLLDVEKFKNEEPATDFAQAVFEYFMFGDQRIFGFDMDDIVKSYLLNKKDVINYNSSLFGLEKTKVKINSKVIDKKPMEKGTIYNIEVDCNFYYSDGQSPMSSISTCIFVKTDSSNNTFKVNSVYDSIGGYELQIWPISEEHLPSNWKESIIVPISCNNSVTDKTLKKTADQLKVQIKRNLNNSVTNYTHIINIEKRTNDIKEKTVSASINLSKVKEYARNNFYKKQPSSGGRGVPYYDFSQLSGQYDCTNFVSHALLAGGAKTNSKWFYRGIEKKDRSASWSGVSALYSYLVNSKVGLRGKSCAYVPYPDFESPFFEEGNILQFKGEKGWAHSTIITGKYGLRFNGRRSIGALVTGRTSPSGNNDNVRAEDMFGTNEKRVIKITGI